MKTYDFVIVGAGPAGLFCSYLLAKQGHEVVVVDAAKQIERKVCGEYLSPAGVQLLKDNGIDFILNNFSPIKGMNIFTAYGQKVLSTFPQKKLGVATNRKTFEESLYHLAKNVGVEIFFDERIESLKNENNIWDITSKTRKFKSKVLIGADGRRSIVARTVKVQIPHHGEKVALHAILNYQTSDTNRGEMHLLKDGSYVGIDPINKNEVNFSLICNKKNIKEYGGATQTCLLAIKESKELNEHIGNQLSNTKISSVFPITHKVTKTAGENWALIGDAAGFTDPLTGEGITHALWSAQILADLFLKNKNYSVKSILNIYQKKHFRNFISKRIIHLFFQFIIKHPKLTYFIAAFLKSNNKRADAFIGIIGNIYSPFQGLKKIFLSI